MKYVLIAAAVAVIGIAALPLYGSGEGRPGIKVYKTATCGCCEAWVEHLEAEGFRVDAEDVAQAKLYGIKQQAGVTRETASCHTAFIDGHVIEGHVPASDIRRFVAEARDGAVGLAVPGMPLGSPGMEMGGRRDAYEVLTLGEGGGTTIFSRYAGE
ncbi:MAG: DUF411 domain-containing protein [Arhodomonas sp.]|nr:DUF411 domain-containing protein [Arhodomonas sp.]